MTRPKFVLSTLLAGVAVALPGDVGAQVSVEDGRRPPKWSVELDLGAQLPGTLYNESVARRSRGDSIPFSTRWKEDTSLGIQGRLALRVNPEAGVGLYAAGLIGHTGTRANFSGALSPPQTITRSADFLGFEAGVTMKLTDWDQGRGLVEYNIGAVALKQTIDLGPGHRDAFAYFGRGEPPHVAEWSPRSFTSWGLSLGTSFRIPIGEKLSLRTSFRDLIVPVDGARLGEQERMDVKELTGESAFFSVSGYTAHHMALSAGLEYTFAWGRPKRSVTRRIPARREEPEVSGAVVDATRLASEGDTAGAVAALEHRVGLVPEDGAAWRELALLRAARAEYDPSTRDVALATLERALNLNPGDMDLLRSYGRVRGLAQREGRSPEAPAVRPLNLSELAVEAGPDGGVRLAWATLGLASGNGGQYRYRAEVQVITATGTPARIRPGAGSLRPGPEGALVLEGSVSSLPASLAVDLFLLSPDPGIYTARVRVTDLETGQSDETAAGFEVPPPDRP